MSLPQNQVINHNLPGTARGHHHATMLWNDVSSFDRPIKGYPESVDVGLALVNHGLQNHFRVRSMN